MATKYLKCVLACSYCGEGIALSRSRFYNSSEEINEMSLGLISKESTIYIQSCTPDTVLGFFPSLLESQGKTTRTRHEERRCGPVYC